MDDIFSNFRELAAVYLEEYREEYEQFTQSDSRDYSYKIFTQDEQIRRHANFLSFWYIKLDELKKDPVILSQSDMITHVNKEIFFQMNIDKLENKIKTQHTAHAIKLIKN